MFKFISRQTELDEKVYDLSVLDELLDAEYIAFDFETTGLDQFTLKPILLGLETGTSFNKDGTINSENSNSYIIDFLTYSIEEVKEYLLKLQRKFWIAHNLVYDYMILQHQFGIKLKRMHCTMLSSQVLYNGSDAIEHNYKAVVMRHFTRVVSKEDVQSFINRDLNLPITRAELTYLKNDLIFLYPLYLKHLDLGGPLKKNLLECFKLENNFIRVMAHMMLNGIAIDGNKWIENNESYRQKVEEYFEKVKNKAVELCTEFNIYGVVPSKKKYVKNQISLFATSEMTSIKHSLKNFNPRSPIQILKLLTDLKIKIESTGIEELQKALYVIEDTRIRDFINELLELRKYEKLVSTYGLKFLNDNINPVTFKIHSQYMQCMTDTGRLSSSKVNVQNIPGLPEIRACFISDDVEIYNLVSLDMANQELRLAASRSQDKTLIKGFNEDLDFHSILAQGSHRIITGDKNFIVSKKENKHLRESHKPVLFGYLYGGGAKRIAEILNIPVPIAKKVYDQLKETLKELTEYQNQIRKKVMQDKYITDGTKFNRRQSFTIWRKKPLEQHQIEKKGINFPIQSGSAAMMKEAGIVILDYIEQTNEDCQIKLQCHDEWLIQFPNNKEYLAEKFRQIMEEVGTSYLDGIRMESSKSIATHWKK